MDFEHLLTFAKLNKMKYMHSCYRLKNKMSIVHVFFGSDTVVPKLRKVQFGITDLIGYQPLILFTYNKNLPLL